MTARKPYIIIAILFGSLLVGYALYRTFPLAEERTPQKLPMQKSEAERVNDALQRMIKNPPPYVPEIEAELPPLTSVPFDEAAATRAAKPLGLTGRIVSLSSKKDEFALTDIVGGEDTDVDSYAVTVSDNTVVAFRVKDTSASYRQIVGGKNDLKENLLCYIESKDPPSASARLAATIITCER